MSDPLTKALHKSISSHYGMLESHIGNNGTPIHYKIDLLQFLAEFTRSVNRSCNSGEAENYLKFKKLSTYGDLLEMHQRIMSYALSTDPEDIMKLEINIMYNSSDPESEPEFYGDGRALLGMFDFMTAIPHIPHSPSPDQPTIMGLFLSSAQAILRNENLFFSDCSHHDLMHLLVMQSTLLSSYARTTTGESLQKVHSIPDISQATAGKLLFEDFTITNAVPFHPEYVLLTGYPHRLPVDAGTSPPTVQLFYNALDSGNSLFLPSPDGTPSQSVTSMISTSISPEFMRVIHSIIT